MKQTQYPKVVNYKNIRHLLKSGDVVVFGGQYFESKMIKLFSGGVASHVGIIFTTRRDHLIEDTIVDVMEANHDREYPDLNGVVVSRLSDRIPFYKGDIWILRLNQEFRKRIDFDFFNTFLMNQVGKEYDNNNQWKTAIDWFDSLGFSLNHENLQRYFCSELVAAALKKAGGLSQINASEISPNDIVTWQIFEPEYYQIKCFDYKAIAIPDYNSEKVY